jgi:uncharacterized membrane protein
MQTLYFLVSLLLLAVHLLALTQAFSRWFPAPVARVVGVLALALPLFALEHLHGLGSLQGVWPITTVLSLALLWRERAVIGSAEIREAELWFWGIFSYALLWRWLAPDLDGNTEKLTNLSFIVTYLAGATLPPPDAWLAGDFRFDFYYGFQHYAAALLWRLFGWSPGLTMNVAQPLLIAFIGSLAAFTIGRWVRSRMIQGLLVAALIAGGNGVTPVLLITGGGALLATTEPFWAATRFAGVYDQRWFEGALKDLWPMASQDLPLETISFYSLIGDYHPPLGGFALLVFALALMAWWCSPDQPAAASERPRIAALLVMTPWLALLTNAWVAPLQALLVGGFMVTRWIAEGLRQWPWQATVVGFLMAILLCAPALGHFSPTAAPVALAAVPDWAATPTWTFVALHWPLLILAIAAVLAWQRAPLALVFVVTAALIVVMGEKLFFDEGGSGPYLRFNTVIKWWSWTLPLLLVGVAPILYRQAGRVSRVLVVLVALLLSSNIIPIVRHVVLGVHPRAGKLQGDAWLRESPAQAALLDYLRERPQGVVLEGMQGGAYNATSAYGLLAGKPLVLGWASHEALWRGASARAWDRFNEIEAFYAGLSPAPPIWLETFDVRYILWTWRDEQRHPGARAVIDRKLSGRYRFRAFERSGEQAMGLWERLD